MEEPHSIHAIKQIQAVGRQQPSSSCSLALLVLIRPNFHRRRLQHIPQRPYLLIFFPLLLKFQPRHLEAHNVCAPLETAASAHIRKRGECIRDDRLGVVQRTVAAVNVDLAECLDARDALGFVGVVAQRDGC